MKGQNGEPDTGESARDPQQPGGTEPAPAFAADDLPVQLVFIAGETDIALRDLRRISPGYVFVLQQPVDGHVEVRANGKAIGRGELVEVDGRVGVRLGAIFGSSDGTDGKPA